MVGQALIEPAAFNIHCKHSTVSMTYNDKYYVCDVTQMDKSHILLEITNRCNCMQSILFLCL